MEHYAGGGPPLSDIAGIAWLDAGGAVRVNDERPNPDMATLPSVMTPRNLREMGPCILYETARGCPFHCSFCNWGSQKTRLRARRDETIESDLKTLFETPGVEDIWLTEAGLDISIDHVTFVSDVIRRYRKTPVLVTGYLFLLHRDLSYVGRITAGIDQVLVGLQTANEDSLSEIGRKALSPRRFDRVLDAVLPFYPDLRVDLIYGLPGIDPAELRDSVRFVLGKGLWLINLFRLMAIPGTELATHKEAYGLVADDEYPYTVYASAGCTADDMFEMHQFKINMDTLRFLLANEGHRRVIEAGIDFVDFASKLHELVPRFNSLVRYDEIEDWVPSPELARALLAAPAAYTADPGLRDALERLIRGQLEQAHVAFDGAASSPSEPAAGGGDEPRRGTERSRHAVCSVRVADGGAEWLLRIERALPDGRYFRTVGAWGLSYQLDPASPAADPGRLGRVMTVVAERLEELRRDDVTDPNALASPLLALFGSGAMPGVRATAEGRRLHGPAVVPAR
jgi:hypothetical protein